MQSKRASYYRDSKSHKVVRGSEKDSSNSQDHYCYVCVKKNGADRRCRQYFEYVMHQISAENKRSYEQLRLEAGGNYELEYQERSMSQM